MSLVKFVAVLLATTTVSQALTEQTSQQLLAQSFGDNPDTFPIPSSLPDGTTLKVDGSTSMRLTNEALESRFEEQFSNIDVELDASRTDAALQALLDGEIDVLATGRPLTDAEIAQGVTTVALEREKLAIILGPDNTFDGDLTFEQFAQIFRGEITNWSELGGDNLPIRLVDRPDYSDTRRALSTYTVFEGQPFETGSTADLIADDETDSAIAALGNDGISYAVVSQVIDRDDVKIIPMHQTLPDDPRYPYSQYRAFAYKEDDTSPAVLAFLGFATTAPGEEVIVAATDGSEGTSPEDPDITDAVTDADADSAAADLEPTAPDDVTAATPEAAADPTADEGAVAGAQTADRDGGFPLWLLWLLAIPLLGGLLWWLIKKGDSAVAPTTGAAGAAIPPTATTGAGTVAPSDMPGAGGVAAGAGGTGAVDMPGASAGAAGAAGIPGAGVIAAGAAGAAAMAAGAAVAGAASPTDEAVTPGADAGVTGAADIPDADAGATGIASIPGADSGSTGIAGIPGAGVIAAGAAGAAAMASPAARMLLTSNSADSVHASWEIPAEQLVEAKRQGGETQMVRLYDVTEQPSDQALSAPVAEFGCAETASDFELPITVADRSYCAEVGYVTADNQWLSLVKSNTVKVPPATTSSGVALGAGMAGAAAAIGAAGTAALLGKAASKEASQLSLTLRNNQEADASWVVPETAKAACKAEGGEDYQLRVYDVTGLDLESQPPNSVAIYGLSAGDCDRTVPLANPQGDYLAEVGYQTSSGDWLMMARSEPVHLTALSSSLEPELNGQEATTGSNINPTALAGGLAAAMLQAPQTDPGLSAPASEAVAPHQGHVQTATVHRYHNAMMLGTESLAHIQHSVASTHQLDSGLHILRLREGIFNYDRDDNHPGEAFVLLWIHGGTVIHPKTGTPINTLWTTLNGYADTLTLDVKAPATLSAFFMDTYPDDNTGELTLSVIKL